MHKQSSNSQNPAPQGGRRLNNNQRFWWWMALATFLVLLDQWTKQYFNTHLYYAERWHVLPFFDFTLLYNPGAAFSFLADGKGWQKWFFICVALGASTLIITLLRKTPQQTLFSLSMSLIMSGAIGNVVDRFQHGHVVDFLLFYWGNAYFPAFNVADICITLGAIFMVLDEFLRLRKKKQQSKE